MLAMINFDFHQLCYQSLSFTFFSIDFQPTPMLPEINFNFHLHYLEILTFIFTSLFLFTFDSLNFDSFAELLFNPWFKVVKLLDISHSSPTSDFAQVFWVFRVSKPSLSLKSKILPDRTANKKSGDCELVSI